MTATLKKVSVASILTTRTLILTATTAVQTIIIGGTISNTDLTGVYHSATVEVQQASDSSYSALVTTTPIALGGSLIFPKVVLFPGDKLYVTADVAAVLNVYVSYVEKS